MQKIATTGDASTTLRIRSNNVPITTELDVLIVHRETVNLPGRSAEALKPPGTAADEPLLPQLGRRSTSFWTSALAAPA